MHETYYFIRRIKLDIKFVTFWVFQRSSDISSYISPETGILVCYETIHIENTVNLLVLSSIIYAFMV